MNDTSNTELDAQLDEILEELGIWYNGQFEYGKLAMTPQRAKQALTSLIKELVAEAKPETMPSNLSPENYDRCERVVNQYHQNLLKALEEV